MKNAPKVFTFPLLVLSMLSGLSACDKAPGPAVEPDATTLANVQSRLASLTRGVDSAEALRSVKRLQWAYGHYSELGLWYDFADLFADGGVGHYVQGDLNRDQIRALFFEQVGQGRLGLAEGRIYPHISFAPVVDLAEDGTHAKGRFRILAMLGGYGGNATWFHGLYENAYVKEQGIWKINEISNTAQVTGNFTARLSAQSKAPLDAPTFAFHYDSGQVGSITAAPAAMIYNDPPQLAAKLYSQQQRLARLDDEAAIVRLQHQYGYYLDQHDWDGVAGLFAEQATFETGQQGVYTSKASIRNALDQFGELAIGDVDEHILFQTYVSLAPDGLSAKARVDQLGMQGKPGASAEWTQGIYENTFVKEDGQWRIQALHYYPRLITDYAKGWGVDAQPAPGPSDSYPPDASPTETYGIYPTFYIPAFHFAHPVTGRAPQYPDGDPASGRAIGFVTTQQAAPAANQASDIAVLKAALDAAEAQSQRALATDAVENLLNAYAYYLDECMPQDAAALFAEDGANEIPGIGYYQGPDRISHALQLAYCADGRQPDALTLHHVLQPVITVAADALTATVVARVWQVHATGADDDYYLMGRLEGAAIRQGTQWKLVSLSTRYTWVASVKEGWAHATENEALGYAAPAQMLAGFPPDRPAQTARLAPYP